MEYAFLLFALLIGLVLGWFVKHLQTNAQYGGLNPDAIKQLQANYQTASENLTKVEERLSNRDDELTALRDEYRKTNDEKLKLISEIASEKQVSEGLREKLASQKTELEEMHARMTDQFKNLANEILEDKSKKFTDQNKVQIDQILKPLGERIRDFEKKVEETYNIEARDKAGLKQQILQLTELNKKMSEDALNLTKALKGESKTQGNWGEMVLERILERSGLNEGQEYDLQHSGTTTEGRRLQPDVVIHLPDEKNLVIDAKVSLTAYERFSSAETDEEQEIYLKQHIQSLRAHVKALSEKNYSQLFDIGTPDFVLLFVPIEPAFGIAMMKEPSLYNDAFERNIVIVSPSTLLATMATIKNIWKYEYQNRNALMIAEEGGKLYDKFVNFADDLDKIGDRIRQMQEAYDGAMNKFSTGRGNLIGRAEKMRKLGAKASKKLDKKHVLAAMDDEDDET